jgi:hypothetical protein
MENGLEGWTMWLIAPSVYTRCHGDAIQTGPTPLTKNARGVVGEHNTQEAQLPRAPHAIELCLPVPKATLLN